MAIGGKHKGFTAAAIISGILIASTARDIAYRFSPDNQTNFDSVARAVTLSLSPTGVSFEENRIGQTIGTVGENGTLRYTVTGRHKAFLGPRDCVRVEFEPFYYGSSGRVSICERADGGIRADHSSARPADVNIERTALNARLRHQEIALAN